MSTYSNSRFGPTKRKLGTVLDDFGASGQHTEYFTWNNKVKIFKFGIIPNTTAVRSTTTGTLVIETESGTDLGSWNFTDQTTIATGTASGNTITATTIPAGVAIAGNVTEEGSKGSFFWFVDYKEQFDATADYTQST